jgi:Domain of Unknown Function (DUF1080)
MMIRRMFVVLGCLMAFGAGAAVAADKKPAAEKPNTLTKAEKKAGWKLLFDGKTTKGWVGYKSPAIPDSWKVIKGVLTLDGKGGDIMTEAEYQDFELVLDWKIASGGNSGLIYRVAHTDEAPYMSGPEYQLLDDAKHPDATAGKDGNHRAGSLYDVYAPAKSVVKPADEWNRTRLVVNGNHVEHWLNGEKVVEAELGSADWNTRVAASKWKKAEKYGKMAKGHIDLQDHGDKIELRSIKILELKAAK